MVSQITSSTTVFHEALCRSFQCVKMNRFTGFPPWSHTEAALRDRGMRKIFLKNLTGTIANHEEIFKDE